MAIAESSRVRTAYVLEGTTPATWAVTPATPAFQSLLLTGGNLATTKATNIVDERIGDRAVRAETMQGLDSAGTLDFTLRYGGFDDMMAAALYGVWTSNVLKCGTTVTSYTFEHTYELGGSSESFHRFPGSMVNTFSIDATTRGDITGSIGMMAQQEVLGTAAITGATYAAANSGPVMSASYDMGSLSIIALNPTPILRRVTFEINNQLRTRPAIGTLFSQQFGAGQRRITGTLEAYFDSQALYQQVLAHAQGVFSFNLGTVSGQKYTVLFPKIQLGNGTINSGTGTGSDVIATINWTALFDSVTATDMQITRAVA